MRITTAATLLVFSAGCATSHTLAYGELSRLDGYSSAPLDGSANPAARTGSPSRIELRDTDGKMFAFAPDLDLSLRAKDGALLAEGRLEHARVAGGRFEGVFAGGQPLDLRLDDVGSAKASKFSGAKTTLAVVGVVAACVTVALAGFAIDTTSRFGAATRSLC